MRENFVSISGVSNKDQLKEIDSLCAKEQFDFPVVIGYQVSNKSINQKTRNSRQPLFSDIGNLIEETYERGMIPAIHYYTKDHETVLEDLEKVARASDRSIVLQFNTLPLDVGTLSRVRDVGFKIIFKVSVSNKNNPEGGYAVWKGDNVTDVSSGSIDPLIEQVAERKDAIDYVMFDPSHGTNLELNLEANSLAVRFGKDISGNPDFDHLGLVYAGGIKPSNVERVVSSLTSFIPEHRISIDIESGVRTNDALNMSLIEGYLRNYKKVFS